MKMLRAWYLSILAASATAVVLEERNIRIGDPCTATCTLGIAPNYAVLWRPMTVTGTITGGNVIVSIDTDAGTTVTSTEYDLPSGVSMPPTNSRGTHIQSTIVPHGKSSKMTTLAFPTQYVSYASGYSWYGTLSTEGVCSTVTDPVFVSYDSIYSWQGPEHITTMPESSSFENGPDPGGLLWTIIEGFAGYGPDPSEDGVKSCTKTASQGEGIIATAQIVFNTMTVTGGSGDRASSYTPPPAATVVQGAIDTSNPSLTATATVTATEIISSNGGRSPFEIHMWLNAILISAICLFFA